MAHRTGALADQGSGAGRGGHHGSAQERSPIPTDAKLMHKAIVTLLALERQSGRACRCANPMSGSPSGRLMMAGRYAHAKQFKRA